MADKIVSEFVAKISAHSGQIRHMYLFGSRSRDDWRPDSDYDILIVLKDKETRIIDSLYDTVMDLLLSTGRLISLKIFSEEEFDCLKSIPTPFVTNVLMEGKEVGI
jgi:predicted nucleotidyltransferase